MGLICLIFLTFLPVNALAHGVGGNVQNFEGGIVITANYDTGEPMSYAKVEIYAPDSQIKFQLGRTDRNGRFAFVPDIPGKWQVVVDDGIGHRLTLKVPVGRKLKIQEKSPQQHIKGTFFPTYIRAIIGIILIFGIWGWIKEIKKISL